jgi:tetratricopeptide (TPR) repeat protein
MSRRITLLVFLAAATFVHARDKNDSWLQVTSPHFVVATNGTEKQGRRIADQFERMRSVFHVAFPKMQVDPDVPIVVLAIKDDKTFKALEPEAYLAKGSLRLGGLFLHVPDKNYVLMRLEAEGDHPYAVIYHEYTHLLLSKAAEWMPLWLNEGLAEYYQNTDIHDKDASMGEPSIENLTLLRQNRLLPLATLFAVDESSPYYHREHQGSIFYAECWALTHYIQVNDYKNKTHRLTDFASLLAQKADPVSAATQIFGDLTKLQQQLDVYVQQHDFSYLKISTTTDVDDSAFAVQPLPPAQADALRADFLAYNQRTADAESLLDQILREDPKNVSARETRGFLEFRQGHLDEAAKWYEQAVELESHSFLAHYYFATITMRQPNGAPDEKIESSLRAAIKLNPSFAPAYDQLAFFLATRRQNLEEARMMELNAISLAPSEIGPRLNMANIWMAMRQPQNAVNVLRAASKLAKTPEQSQMLDNALMHATEYAEAQARMPQLEEHDHAGEQVSSQEVPRPTLKPRLSPPHHPDFVAKGPHKFLVGVLQEVRCDNPALDLTVAAKGKTLAVHSDNYFMVNFTTLGFRPTGDLNPCADLKDRPAKVEYVESADPSVSPQLISVELHK